MLKETIIKIIPLLCIKKRYFDRLVPSKKNYDASTKNERNGIGPKPIYRFYVEARTKKGEEYSRSALLAFRNVVERHLNNNEVTLKIAKNNLFQKSNKILDAKLRINRRAGKENVQHKPVIISAELAKIRESPFLSMESPAGLLRRTWFYVSLYSGAGEEEKGNEPLHYNSFEFLKDANGRDYAIMTHEEATKNHPGEENSKPSAEKETRLYSTGAQSDAFASLKMYVSRLNPSCKAFFQRPKPNITAEDKVWYENKPIGVHKLADMMKEISIGADLSRTYTNHSVRAAAITLLSNANVPDRHIMFVSGHSSEQSIAHYSSRPSVSQLENVSDTISSSIGDQHPPSLERSTENRPTGDFNSPVVLGSTNQMAASVSMSMANFSSGFFSSCNIGNIQVFLGQQSHSSDNK